jgi:hypothetical protein
MKVFVSMVSIITHQEEEANEERDGVDGRNRNLMS